MRLLRKTLKTMYIKPWTTEKDDEGCITNNYGEAYEVEASIQPLGGELAAAEYGENLTYMVSMRVDNSKMITLNNKACIQVKNGVISEKDGVCVYVDSISEPDYEVASIKPWTIPVLELKRRGVTGG